MDIASNKSYKDQYHFRGYKKDFGKDLPSLKTDPPINIYINENPYEDAVNTEIEKGELVLQNDLSALWVSKGKKHSQGGTDVYLKPESFVFSDDPTLSLIEDDHKLFELKPGKGVRNNTPAKVLRKNVDIKHYNTLFNNLLDPNKDDLAKKSSARMLEKYLQTVGNIGYIQEEKKDFPQGVPYFSNGTAPIYDTELKEEIDGMKQYAKYGGTIEHKQPGGPKKRVGRVAFPETSNPWWTYDNFNQSTPLILPEDPILQNIVNRPTPPSAPSPYRGSSYTNSPGQRQKSLNNVFNWLSGELGYTGPNSIGDMQTFMASNYPEVVSDYMTLVPNTNKGRRLYGQNSEGVNLTLEQRLNAFQDGLWDYRFPMVQPLNFENQADFDKWVSENPDLTKTPEGLYRPINVNPNNRTPLHYFQPVVGNTNVPDPSPYTDQTEENYLFTPKTNVQKKEEKLGVQTVNPTPQAGIPIEWQFTPWQRLSQSYNLGKLATTKRYMPYRSKFNSTYVEPTLLNPEQTIADAQGIANQQLSSLNTLSPILRNAQANSIYGQFLSQIPTIRSNYDNQNAQILNQTKQFNTQLRNQESQINMQNDQRYYDQTIQGQQNFDNMKNYLADQYMNNLMRDVESNQQLAYNLATLDNPAFTFDFRSGNLKRLPKNPLDARTGNRGDLLSQYLGRIEQNWDQLNNKEKIDLLKIMTARGFTPNPIQKKGGFHNPYLT